MRRSLAVDAGLAGLTLALTLAMLSGQSRLDARDLDSVGVVLAVASAAPLVGRRLAPLTVHAVTGAASLALLGFGFALDFPFGPLVAVYTLAVAYGGDRWRGRRGLAVLATAAFVALAAAVLLAREPDAVEVTGRMAVWALGFVGAWLGGDRTRLRRERFAELTDQAARTEREAERERRLAAAEERTRIARELHDSTGHAINVILVQAGAARLLHRRSPDESRQAIATIEQLARETIEEIDQLVRALRTDDDSAPLVPATPAALDELVARHRAGGLRVTMDVDGSPDGLPRSVAWATYRILQEALTNAARHGRGSAGVVLRFEPDAVDATVTNQTTTKGIAPSGGEARRGHGIIGMRERATLLGGVLETAIDNGIFRLHIRLPYGEGES